MKNITNEIIIQQILNAISTIRGDIIYYYYKQEDNSQDSIKNLLNYYLERLWKEYEYWKQRDEKINNINK